MNAVYKSIWNESLGAWVATAENTAARGKKGSSKKALAMPVVQAVAAAAALAFAAPSWAIALGTTCSAPSAYVVTPASASTVNCNDATYTSIEVNSQNASVTVNLTQANATVTSQYKDAIGVYGREFIGNTTTVNTQAGQKLTVNAGEGGSGINATGYAVTVNNKAEIELKDTNASSAGIRVYGYGGNPTVNNEGKITTLGEGSNGIKVETRYSSSGSEAPKATINHNAGTITTSGASASGLYIESSSANGTYDITSSGNVSTSGSDAHGIYATISGEGAGNPGTANVTVNAGTVSATGNNSAGIQTDLYLYNREQATSNVTINGGSVSGGWGDGLRSAGVQVMNGDSEITIASGASLGSLSDVAIDTAGERKVSSSPSNARNSGTTYISNSGTMTGEVYTSRGNTTINNDASGIWNLRKWSSSAGGARDTVGDVNVVLGNRGGEEGPNNTINNNGLIRLTQISGHNAAQNATFSGLSNFNNNATGTLSMVNGFAGDKITINGNYNAQTGAKVNMDVVLNGDTSASDKLVINGTATGPTKVYVTNVGGTGGQTTNGISLIEINPAEIILTRESVTITAKASGPITAQAIATPATFTLGAPVQAGNYEYFLNAKGTGYALESTYSATPVPTPTPTPAPSAAPTPTPTPVAAPTPAPQVLRPGVVAYSLASQTNFELNQVANGTYNDRIGAQTAAGANNGWVRVGASNVDLTGAKSFDIKQKHSFVQGGKDLLKSTDSGTTATTGVAASYSNSDNTLYNRDRLKGGFDSKTGSLKSTQMTLAGYHTRQLDDGSIIDIVGALSSLENKFSDVNGTGGKQTGTGVALSVEFAKPIAIMNGSMTLEPQAQLSFQNHSYKAFNDGVATIDAYSADSLRARVGMRLSMGDKTKPAAATEANSFYFSANLLQDLIAPEGVTIGGGTIQDDVNKKTWLEVGLGGQAKVGGNATVYGSVNYQKSISGSSRSGAAGNVGVKVAF